MLVSLEPAAPRSRVKHSTTELLHDTGSVHYVHKVSLHFICAKASNVDVSIGAGCLTFGQCLHLHPYFLYVNSKVSGKS